MWKTAAAGAAALVITGSMMVHAQQRQGGSGGPGGYGGPREVPAMGDWAPSPQDLSAFADARIAALHAGLQLNADQEKNWPPFEQALREMAKMRIERLSAARDEQQSANPIERLQRRAEVMTTRGAALKRLADAAAPLYQSLDEAQKHRFAILARFMRPRLAGRMMWGDRFGGEGGGMPGHGFQMGPHGFGDGPGMRGPHGGMGGMNGMNGMGGRDDDDEDEDEDYRGPL
jgi:hypothetical protein